MTLSVLVVEDETEARKQLIENTKRSDLVELVFAADCLETAKELLAQQEIDVMILDISLPDGSGLDLAEDNGLFENTLVIFATAHHEFALQAFKKGSVDYLLKPYTPRDLERALLRAQKLRSLVRKDLIQSEMREATRILKNKENRISLKDGKKVYYVDHTDIIYIKSDGCYADFHLQIRKISVRDSMARLKGFFEEFGFERVHRSYIINISHLDYIHKIDPNHAICVMKNGDSIPVSRSYRGNLLQTSGDLKMANNQVWTYSK